jgi:hypothetical protein
MTSQPRSRRVFNQAERILGEKIEAIRHRNSARGLLKSGPTIKAFVCAADEQTDRAVAEALEGISAVTQHSAPKRKKLLKELRNALSIHHITMYQRVKSATEGIGLASDFKHAVPLIKKVETRHYERITDFAEGWTAPPERPWHERHAILVALGTGVAAALVGALATAGLTSH